jgi:Xaa-Pro aminopeptidase
LAFTTKHFRDRQTRLRKRLKAEDLDFLILSNSSRLQYLVGFTGSNGLLLVGGSRTEFFTDGRYREQVRTEVKSARTTVISGALLPALREIKSLTTGRPRIGFEAESTSAAAFNALQRALPKSLFVPLNGFLAPQMEIKDAEEIACIKKAAGIADRAFLHVLDVLKPGVRERDIAAELEYFMMRAGSEKPAFDTIVASGHRSALPHGRASDKRIQKGDFVTMDYGAIVAGYASDITRTIVVGKATARQRRVYDLVYRAQRAAVEKARSGLSCADLDRTARKIIEKAGHGRRFDHGLGHGLGLNVHEAPSVSFRNPGKLKSGMVITIEPGVYFPGWGGVRIEDDIVVRPKVSTVLTTAERGLIEL